MDVLRELAQYGLYSPDLEHDSCGVGLVANVKGEKSHQIVTESLQVLINLGHRGACGRDPETGDGAGVLVQMPDAFLRKQCDGLGISLPPAGRYGAGMVFLPPEDQAEAKCRSFIEKVISDEGMELLGWRDVPTNPIPDRERRAGLCVPAYVRCSSPAGIWTGKHWSGSCTSSAR